jgi:hypothetical protein
MLRREVQALEELDALESDEAAVSAAGSSWEDPAMLKCQELTTRENIRG